MHHHRGLADKTSPVIIVDRFVTRPLLNHRLTGDRTHQRKQPPPGRVLAEPGWAPWVSVCKRTIRSDLGPEPTQCLECEVGYLLTFSYCVSEIHLVMFVFTRNFSTKWFFFFSISINIDMSGLIIFKVFMLLSFYWTLKLLSKNNT